MEEVEEDEAVDVVVADEDAVAEEDEVEDVTRIKTTQSQTKAQVTTTITLGIRMQTLSQLKMVADEEKLPMVAAGEEKEGLLEGVVNQLEEKDVAEVDADVAEKEAMMREAAVEEEQRTADRIAPRLQMSHPRKANSTTDIVCMRGND